MRRIALCAALLALTSWPTWGSTVVDESIEEVAASAPVVVHAIVRQSQSAWADGGHIWTWTELSVTEALKGKPGTVILVKQPGGVVGPIGQAVSGAAKFEVGEEVVVFLEKATDEANVYVVRGLAAGKVRFATVLGQRRALRELDGLNLMKTGRFQVLDPNREPRSNLGSPEAFLQRVRLAVAGVNQ